jgi:hypothetical protein
VISPETCGRIEGLGGRMEDRTGEATPDFQDSELDLSWLASAPPTAPGGTPRHA